MALTPRGEAPQEQPKNEYDIPVPRYDGQNGWDTDEHVVDNIEICMEEFIKVLYSKDMTAEQKKMAAITAMAIVHSMIERREKNKGKR